VVNDFGRNVLWLLSVTGDRKMEAIAAGPSPRNGEVSPNGRWLAYETNEAGTYQVFVRPFGTAQGPRWPVSTDGGVTPVWRRDGRELFYVGPTRSSIMHVTVGAGPVWNAGPPAKLLDGTFTFSRANVPGRLYDVSRDGTRFVALTPAMDIPQHLPNTIVVVQNWLEELKQRVPTK
jgi:hypothetical protein